MPGREELKNTLQYTQSLCGVWDYRVGAGDFNQKISVPFTREPVGRSACRKIFDSYAQGNALLRIGAVAYRATVSLNGNFLGTLLPYVPYQFEIGGFLKKADNELIIEIEVFRPPSVRPKVGRIWAEFSIRSTFFTGNTLELTMFSCNTK